MIVCHCQRISDSRIDAAIQWMRASNPDTIVTPGKIFRALGKSPVCGSCMPRFLEEVARNPYTRTRDGNVADRESLEGADDHERRQQGH